MTEDYMVYFHVNVLTGERFYVGKGRKKRPYSKHGRSIKWNEYVAKNGGDFNVEIFKSGLTNQEASILETSIMNDESYNLINEIRNSVHKKGLLSIVNAFEYDPTSPTFLRWKSPKFGSNKKPGDVAGSLVDYVYIYHNGLSVKGHRLIWVMHNKCEIPDGMVINHIDCNKHNNAIENLECVSIKENNQKAPAPLGIKIRKDNSTGVNGVSKLRSTNNNNSNTWHYLAHCKVNEEQISKAFAVNKYGEELAKEMAISWREAMVEFNYDKEKAQSMLDSFNNKYLHLIDNGYPEGVFYTTDDGRELFIANITVNKKVKRRKFSTKKYGYDEALRLATEWRKQMEELYYNKPEQ